MVLNIPVNLLLGSFSASKKRNDRRPLLTSAYFYIRARNVSRSMRDPIAVAVSYAVKRVAVNSE